MNVVAFQQAVPRDAKKEINGGAVSVNSRIARLASLFGAVAVTRATPAWMVAKGWSQVECRVTREQWESGRLTMFSSRPATSPLRSNAAGG